MLISYAGYSGVAIYTRNSKCCPLRAEEGITGVLTPVGSSTKFRDLPADQQIGGYPTEDQLTGPIDEATLDSEGRCLILEFPAFVLIGTYCPATRDDSRTDFRIGFLHALDARIRNLVAMRKQVVLAGDLNIIRSEPDSAGLLDQLRKEDMTIDDFLSMPSRRFFNQLIFEGQVTGERDEGREDPVMWDLCRSFHPDRRGMYTCWETKKNARPGNFGSRIDYILCTPGIKGWFEDSNIQEGLMGSDHCPVYATLADTVKVDDKDVPVVELMNPKDMFEGGKRTREWNTKDLLPLSAKLIPEFDRRRSIKDMFFKKPAASKTKTTTTSPAITTSTSTENKGAAAETPAATQPFDAIVSSKKSPTPKEAPSPSTLKALRTAPSPATPPAKRPAPMTTNQPQQKKQKTTLTKEKAKSGVEKGQSSLKGFFKPKVAAASANEEEAVAEKKEAPSPRRVLGSPAKSAASGRGWYKEAGEAAEDATAETSGDGDNAGGGPSDGDRVFDPIESKESWSKLLGKRVAPKCEHGEPCMSMLTKKPGINCGKSKHQEIITRFVLALSRRMTAPMGKLSLTCDYRQIILHVLTTTWAVGAEGDGDAVAMRHVHMEFRLEQVTVA